MTQTLCPVCGFDLGLRAWDGPSASDEICPSCGIQFGYDDAAGGDVTARSQTYLAWRERWKSGGMRWWSKERPRPPNWNPEEQVSRVRF